MGTIVERGVLEARDGNVATSGNGAKSKCVPSDETTVKEVAGSVAARQQRLSSLAVAAKQEVEGLRRERSRLRSQLAKLSSQVSCPPGTKRKTHRESPETLARSLTRRIHLKTF